MRAEEQAPRNTARLASMKDAVAWELGKVKRNKGQSRQRGQSLRMQ